MEVQQLLLVVTHAINAKDIDELFDEAEFAPLAYEAQWRQYRLRIASTVSERQRATLFALMHRARERFGKPA